MLLRNLWIYGYTFEKLSDLVNYLMSLPITSGFISVLFLSVPDLWVPFFKVSGCMGVVPDTE